MLNNWTPGVTYPNAEPFKTWMSEKLFNTFYDEKWVIENKLVIACRIIDQSLQFAISAPKEWVVENCPELLTKYSQFIWKPEGDELDQWEIEFLEYDENNIGLTYME